MSILLSWQHVLPGQYSEGYGLCLHGGALHNGSVKVVFVRLKMESLLLLLERP